MAYIGDIHGCRRELDEVLEHALSRSNRLIFLGDYVNRGPDSRGVLDRLSTLAADPKVDTVFLRGNHDSSLLDFLNGGDVIDFLMMGGASTILNYLANPLGDIAENFRKAFPPAHKRFLESLVDSNSAENVLATHDLLRTDSSRFVVHGHVVQSSLTPLISATSAAIDTGCGTTEGGRLSVFYWPERNWFQSGAWDSDTNP
ncbi:metallophosphoesterase [Microcella alkaliphila]|uniref:metallophosphoesterase n=1 Tax=Microcella alkaliphila TaxID=279828 RepID=UPI000BBAF171